MEESWNWHPGSPSLAHGRSKRSNQYGKEQSHYTSNEQGRQGGYASVNGLNLYYEVHGTGEALILLHGKDSFPQ